MRRDTKLAIVIGLIVVGVGAWYITLPDVSEPSDADALKVDKAPEKADSPLAKGTDSDQAVDETPAKRTPLAKPDARRSPRLALPTSLAQATSRPAGASAVGAITTRPARAEIKPEVVKRKAPPKARELYKWHVIQSGDNYSVLAKRYLGSAKYAPLLAKANPGMLPRRLMVGAKIKIPNLPAPSASATGASPAGASVNASPVHRLMAEPLASVPKDRAYKVKDGDGWSTLADRFLGDSSRWPELYELNRERVPRNRNVLPVGAVIELPKSAKKK